MSPQRNLSDLEREKFQLIFKHIAEEQEQAWKHWREEHQELHKYFRDLPDITEKHKEQYRELIDRIHAAALAIQLSTESLFDK